MNNKIKCEICGKEYSKMGIKSHIWRSHGEGKDFTPFKNNIPWNQGKVLSQEYKNKISNSLKGKSHKQSEETKKKISKNGKGKIGGYRPGSGRGKQGWYKGYWCDSSWELAFVIYNLEHNIKFERNTQKFEYEYNGKHKYIPDFIMEDGTYIEIKGYETEQSKIKHNQFPYKIQLLKWTELKHMIQYVEKKYGKDFIKLYGEVDPSRAGPSLEN